MSGGYFGDALTLIISTLFGIYILTVMLRFLFQLVRADFYNPLSQAIVTITNPPLRPLRRLIPGFRGIDIPSLVLMLSLQMLETWLLFTIDGIPRGAGGIAVIATAKLLQLAVYVFLFAIIIQVIVSWIAPGAYNSLTQLLYSLTAPVMKPARALVPPFGGLDFSPLVVLLALQLILLLVINPIVDVGKTLL